MDTINPKILELKEPSDNVIHTVDITFGLCQLPLRIRMRRFQVQEKDMLDPRFYERGWKHQQGLQHYCLADVKQATQDFISYIKDNALVGLMKATRDSDEVVRLTFDMISSECQAVNEKAVDGKSDTGMETTAQSFLRRIVEMCFALRHEGTRGRLVRGPKALLESQSNRGGGVAIPRMMMAQLDCILHKTILPGIVPPLLREMEVYLFSQKGDEWFEVYLSSFLLLQQISKRTLHQARWALNNQCWENPLVNYNPPPHITTYT